MAGAVQKTGMRVAPVSACIFTVGRLKERQDIKNRLLGNDIESSRS